MGFLIGPVFKVVDSSSIRDFVTSFTIIAIVIVLIDNGLEFNIPMLFKTMIDSTLFTLSVNILITIIVGLVLSTIFKWNLLFSYFIGVISAGSTTIIIPFLLKDKEVQKDAKKLISLESILNDTSLIIIAVAILEMIKTGEPRAMDAIIFGLRIILIEFVKGIIFAAIFFAIWFKSVKAIPTHKKRNYIFILGLLFILYSFTEILQGNGIIAVLTFSILLGNVTSIMKLLKLKDKRYRKDHIETLKSIELIQMDFSFFTRSLFFVVLGLLIDINSYTLMTFAIALTLILIILITRFVCVKSIFAIEHRYKKHKQNIITIVPKGFIATLLIFLPYSEGIFIPQLGEVSVLIIVGMSFIAIYGNKLLKGKKAFIEKGITDFKE
jgi:potassium/hydrogen antiporter